MSSTTDRHARFGAVLCLLAGAWVAWYWINAAAEPGVTAADAPASTSQRRQPLQQSQRQQQPLPINQQHAPSTFPSQAQPPQDAAATLPTTRGETRAPLSQPQPATEQSRPTAAAADDATTQLQPTRYLTQRNDTLSDIAQRFYGRSADWRRIHEANQEVIPNPNRLPVGIWIDIPPPHAPNTPAPAPS